MPPHMLRNSERRDFKRCPQRWWWGWREGLKPSTASATPNALWFGTGVHLVLAHWYCGPGAKRGKDPLAVWEAYVADEIRFIRTQSNALDYNEDEYVEAGALGRAMLENYFSTYGRHDSWSVIIPEQAFTVEIPQPGKRSGAPLIIMAGTYDLVYRDLDDDNLYLGEHKTAKAIDTKHLPLDDQAGTYWAVATDTLRANGSISKSETLSGITYNFLRKAKPDDRPRNPAGQYLNKDGTVSQRQPSPLLHRETVERSRRERRTQIERIQAEALNMERIRANPQLLFKNPTRDCSWDCVFYDMCTLHEAGSDWQDFRDSMFRREDPYADHRKSA